MMLSKLRKISKDLIIYSVLAAEFERLDFKNDALAGVRANYFNAKCSPQAEKTDLDIDGKAHNLAYSMKKGEPLSWKITTGSRPVQTVRRASDNSYCVLSYGDNGVVFKRQYFDAGHLWLRTEYYSRTLENAVAAVIYPRMADGLTVLRMQRFLQTGIESCDLYPSAEKPKKRCAALIYSNSGMIWYDARFKPAQLGETGQEAPEEGFRFTREAFMAESGDDPLSLRSAPYLSEADAAVPEEAAPPESAEPEPGEYSAYDRIESILFEAHKTNKNIFGELASHSMEDEKPEEPERPEEPEEPKEPEEPDDEPDDEPDEEPDDESAARAETEPEPDTLIGTKNGDYAYYGALDSDGRRTGRGRTVTPDGLTAYDGDYSADKRHGFGVCYYKEGSPNYAGDWENGDRSGRGVGFRRSDGIMHAGKWAGNKPDGFGARFDRDGNFLDVCTYVDGVRNGKSLSFDEEGNAVVRFWKDGELISEKIISD